MSRTKPNSVRKPRGSSPTKALRAAKDLPTKQRRCILSNRECSTAHLIRFVADPDNRIVPDLAERLPGRGLWLSANITALAGGECIELGSRRLEVAYTPGHASHHVSYFDPSSRVAYVGDTAGVTIAGDYVLPPTPPPDIDLEAWRVSLKQIESWGPESLFITHYGIRTNPQAQLESLRKNIDRFAKKSRQLLEESGTADERLESFTIWVRNELRREMGEAQAAIYDLSAPLNLLWLGLARYWSKKGISS